MKKKKQPKYKIDLDNIEPRTLSNARNFLMFALIVDLLLVIGFLKMRNLGIFGFVLILCLLSFVLILERRQNDKMEDKIIKHDEEEELEEPEPVESGFGNVAKELEDAVEGVRKEMEEAVKFKGSYV